MVEAADVVSNTASSIVDSTATKCLVQVYQDRRGWEIHTMVAVEDQHCMEGLLDVAKTHLQEACQSTKCVSLVSNKTNTLKDVHCGFRALLAFVDDESRAGMPICEFEKCPNPDCPNQHPTRIKRLYVMVKTNRHSPQPDFNDNISENQASYSSNAASALSALSTQSAGSAQSAGSLSSMDYSGSTDGFLGDDGNLAGSDGAVLLPFGMSHDISCEQPRIRARPPDQNSFDLLIQSHLRPSCVISL